MWVDIARRAPHALAIEARTIPEELKSILHAYSAQCPSPLHFSRRRPATRAQAGPGTGGSGEQGADDLARDVGQPVVAAAVSVRQALVVEAHEVEYGGVEVVDVDLVLDGVPAELVGGAVDDPAPD